MEIIIDTTTKTNETIIKHIKIIIITTINPKHWYKDRRQRAQNVQQHMFTGMRSDKVNGFSKGKIGAMNVEYDEYLDEEIKTNEANQSKINDDSVDKVKVFKN